jgi:hypothetical protein
MRRARARSNATNPKPGPSSSPGFFLPGSRRAASESGNILARAWVSFNAAQPQDEIRDRRRD